MEFERGVNNKIPYDEEPILRRSVPVRPREVERGGASSFGKLLICLLLIVNVVLGVLVINVYKSSAYAIGDTYTVNNTIQGASMSQATSKAVLSAVCVSAGTYEDSEGTHSASELKYFYNVKSRGAGVIYSIDKSKGDALIVTNYHVIEPDVSNVYILLYGSQVPIQVSVVGVTSTYDVAVLKVTSSNELRASGAVACTAADSSKLAIGDMCVAIGNPLAMGIASTIGNVSVPYEYMAIQGGGIVRVIRTDSAINAGNSGGGLFNEKGEFIGIINAKISNTSVENVAFAIPSNLVLSIADNLVKNNGVLKKLTLGMTIQISSSTSSYNQTTGRTLIDYVVKVSEINLGSPANICDMHVDDILVSMTYDGKTIPVNHIYTIEDNVFNLNKNSSLSFTIKRTSGGVTETKEINFTIQSNNFTTVS